MYVPEYIEVVTSCFAVARRLYRVANIYSLGLYVSHEKHPVLPSVISMDNWSLEDCLTVTSTQCAQWNKYVLESAESYLTNRTLSGIKCKVAILANCIDSYRGCRLKYIYRQKIINKTTSLAKQLLS
jgi:hypothetical protein